MLSNKISFLVFISISVFFLCFWGCSKSFDDSDGAILATVGDSTISADLINNIFDESKPRGYLSVEQEYEIKKNILENIIDKQLLAFAAIDSGFDKMAKIKRRLKTERQKLEAQLYYIDNITSKSKYYEDKLDTLKQNFSDEVKLSIIRLNAPPDTALSVYKRLMNGVNFKLLVINYSIDLFSKSTDGITDFVPKVYYPAKVRTVIDTLKVGTYSRPFLAADSYWIIKIEGFRKGNKPNNKDYAKLSVKARKLTEAKLSQELSDSLWERYNPLIDRKIIALYEKRLKALPHLNNSVIPFKLSYFTEDELNTPFVIFDDDTLSFSGFLDGFSKLRPALYPIAGDDGSYIYFLKRLLFDKMLYKKAEEDGYYNDSRFKLQWRLIYIKTLSDYMMIRINGNIKITDNDILGEYNRNKTKYTVEGKARVREILLDNKDDAERVLKMVNNGGSFGELAYKFSKRRYSAVKKGDLGWITAGEFPKYYKETQSAEIGDIIGPIKTSKGFGIIKVENIVKPKVKKFDDVKYDIRSDLLAEARRKAKEDILKELRKRYNAKINYKLLETLIISNRKIIQ